MRSKNVVAVIVAASVFAAVAIVAAVFAIPSVVNPAGSSDQRAVRAWLRENSDSGKWQEVKWYPTRIYPSGTTVGGEGKQWRGSIRVARLKRRESTALGTAVIDNDFVIVNGKVELVTASDTDVYTPQEQAKDKRQQEQMWNDGDPFRANSKATR